MKLIMVCGTCGSADVRADAYAYWDVEKQEWVLSTTFDKGSSCEVCEGECSIEEMTLDDWQEKLTKSEDLDSPHLGIEVEIGVEHIGEEDDDKWLAIVSESDVGVIFKGGTIYASPDDAKDAARRWAIHGKETGSF